jgi:hypothetical protein
VLLDESEQGARGPCGYAALNEQRTSHVTWVSFFSSGESRVLEGSEESCCAAAAPGPSTLSLPTLLSSSCGFDLSCANIAGDELNEVGVDR